MNASSGWCVCLFLTMFPLALNAGIPARWARLISISDSLAGRPAGGHREKCGLGNALDLIDHAGEMTPGGRREIESILARPVLQKRRVIGHFSVFYDTTGFNAPALLDAGHSRVPGTVEAYIDSVGKYFNEAWDVEVDTLGYDAPPFLGGESTYDVYVEELGNFLYGQTWPDSQINSAYPPQFNSYIEVDNDYLGFYSEGIAGLAVTSAHEFHHAIQLGRYAYWSSDRYFLEITSTWMEDVVHTDVNDYYQYLSDSLFQTSQFSYPGLRFTLTDGSIEYSRAVWGKFVEKRFGRDLMRQTWNYIRQSQALTSLDRALNDAGSSFRNAFVEWAMWNMHTGPSADTVLYYTEGLHYPSIRMKPVIQYTGGTRSIADTIQSLSSSYRPVDVSGARMVAVIVNLAQPPTGGGQPFTYIVSDAGDDTYRHLSNGLFTRLNVQNPANWVVQESVPEVVQDVVVFPNPYLVKGSERLHFRLPPVQAGSASLTIISSSMDRVWSGTVPVSTPQPSEPALLWDGRTESGEPVASGVYFFFITVEGRQLSGKFAVIRN